MDIPEKLLTEELDDVINEAAAGEPIKQRLYKGVVRYKKIYYYLGIAICVFYGIFAIAAIALDSLLALISFMPVMLPAILLIRGYRRFKIDFDEDKFTLTEDNGSTQTWYFYEVMAFEEAENRFIIYLPDRDIEIPARCENINEFLQNMPMWTRDK